MTEFSVGDELTGQLDRLLQRCSTRELIASAENGHWPSKLWSELEELGIPVALAPESAGGHGLPLHSAFGVFRSAGYYAAPVPLVDTMLANLLLGEAGGTALPGPVLLYPGVVDCSPDAVAALLSARGCWTQGHGTQRSAERFAENAVVITRASQGHCICAVRAPVELDRSPPTLVPNSGELRFVSAPRAEIAFERHIASLAIGRSAQIAGALNKILDLSVEYADSRRQFGKPIREFQAVSHMLARLAMEVAGAEAAANFGIQLSHRRPKVAAAIAKIKTSKSAAAGAALAHQIHGAIGMTSEYELHIFTRQLSRWRDDAGSEYDWAELLSDEISSLPEGEFWPGLIAVVDERVSELP